MNAPCVRALVAAAVLAAADNPVCAAPAPLLINESASLPPGLYRRAPQSLDVGMIVAVRPPRQARAYLATLGAPASARLLKRVAARPGEQICRWGPRFSWPRGNVRAASRDRRDRALPRWSGCRRLGPNEFAVLGDTPTSFDSRYFGPVPRADLDGAYVRVGRW